MPHRLGAQNRVAYFILPPDDPLPLDQWRLMILSSARSMMTHLIRCSTLKPPTGTSSEVAECELADLFQLPSDPDTPTDVPSAVFPLLEPLDTDPDVLRFRTMATIHHYRG